MKELTTITQLVNGKYQPLSKEEELKRRIRLFEQAVYLSPSPMRKLKWGFKILWLKYQLGALMNAK